MKKSSNAASRRIPGRRKGFRPTLGIIQEGVHNMSLHDPGNGIGNFLAGTPDKRSSQPFGANTPCGRVTNPTQSECSTSTEGRSNDTSYTRTRTSESSAKNSRTTSASNLSSDEKATGTKANGPIYIVPNKFTLSDDDEEEIENLSGEVVYWDRSNPQCLGTMTVLVASKDNTTPVAPHTTPVLFAMSKGVPIVTSTWLKKSLHQREFLPMDNYLLKDDKVAETIDMTNVCDAFFPLSKAIANGIEASTKGGIIAGYWFKLCPDIGKVDNDFTRKELKVLLQAAGASALSADALEGMDSFDNLLVVTSMKATNQQVEFANKLVECCGGGMRVTSMLVLQMLLLQSKAPLERLMEKRAAEKQKEASDNAAFHTFAPGPPKELCRFTLVEVSRTLSKPNEGDKNRKGGTLQIVEFGSTKYVHYFDQEGNIKLKAEAPSKFLARNEMFGNAGDQNVIAWEVTNKSGGQIINRRHFFWFQSRAQLDTCLVTLFGIEADPSTNQSILEEWYDEEGSFYEEVFTLPAHVIVKDEDEMDVEIPVRLGSKPRAALICEHGCDPFAASP